MLTQRQHQLLQYIHGYMADRGVPPSFEEMRDALRLRSKSGIHRLIKGLEERGYIRRLPYRARALELTREPPPPRGGLGPIAVIEDDLTNVVKGRFPGRSQDEDDELQSCKLPLHGRIAAGTPIEALRDNHTQIEVPPHLIGTGEHYALEVVGDSMIEAGIQDGDVVIIQCRETAENGDVVVALIDDAEATLKRLRMKGKTIALEAANPAYETRLFGAHRVKIQGRLTGLMRRY
ncbi:MAG: transcriptional repressor LexA [Geminicoccaceae bacterium]|nr:transcriptional repressor LexA [Geminicoccaceae bacterium]